MLETARKYVGDELFTPYNFEEVDLEIFLRTYLWVIYVAGFRNAVVEQHFVCIKAAFQDLDLDRIVAMEAVDANMLPIRNQRKADAFLQGCRSIHTEGWQGFKQRLMAGGQTVLGELPWMGPATKQHMALVLGLEDTEKCDTWIMQCADACSATVDEMVTFLSQEYDLTRQQVDNYLWKYCRDHQRMP